MGEAIKQETIHNERPDLDAADAIIRLRNVNVQYRSYKEQPSSLKEQVIRFVKHGVWNTYKSFDAVQNLDIDIRRGEIFGILGSNGSGKSTLLKVLAGVLPPTSGGVHIGGSVASLIGLGVGFDPDLNAIENIYLNASLHRKPKKEIDAKVEHILSFAEIGDFALTPIKYYSSGMAARLGFAVAVDVDPDILLIDEVLAVGDERFQQKCLAVFERLLASGKTIVIVSHTLDLLETRCDRVGLMERGNMCFVGNPSEAIELYRSQAYKTVLAQNEVS